MPYIHKLTVARGISVHVQKKQFYPCKRFDTLPAYCDGQTQTQHGVARVKNAKMAADRLY